MNILLVDDHEIVRDGLAYLLEKEFSPELIVFAADGREAIQKATNLTFDLVMMDLSMPDGLGGILTLQQLRKLVPRGKIIIFSMYDEIEYQRKALELGADGYLVKRLKKDELLKAIGEILQGVRDEITLEPLPTWKNPLSHRELDTLILTLKGYSQKDIAETMSITVKTVENHRRSISKKLATSDKKEWLEFAQKHKLLKI